MALPRVRTVLLARNSLLNVIVAECTWTMLKQSRIGLMFARFWALTTAISSFLASFCLPAHIISSYLQLHLTSLKSQQVRAAPPGRQAAGAGLINVEDNQSNARDQPESKINNYININAGFLFSFAASQKEAVIKRALSQALERVENTSESSKKYESARLAAEKLVHENLGNEKEVVAAAITGALEAGLSRKILMLEEVLEKRQSKVKSEERSWPWLMLGGMPLDRTAMILLPSVPFVTSLLSVIFTLLPTLSFSTSKCISYYDKLAEKYAQELVWIVELLSECSALDGAIALWSSASNLAALTRNASPRVRSHFMQLSIFLLQKQSNTKYDALEDATLRLLLWCLSLIGSPIFNKDGNVSASTLERDKIEMSIRDAIDGLSKVKVTSFYADKEGLTT